MAKDILSNRNFVGGAKLTGLPAATAAGEAVTFEQMNSAVEGLAWKDSVRVLAPGNVNLAAPGATIDGITMATNDRFLAPNQTTGAQNGIYIFNGASTPATRSLDMSTSAEVEAAVVTVEEGTSANSTFRQTAINPTLDTTTLTFGSFGTASPAASETISGIIEIATQAETDAGTDDARAVTPAKLANHSGRKRKTSGTIGDGTATTFTITHNFNMREVQVEVYRNSGNYDTVGVDISRPSVNTVVISGFATAPTTAQLAYVILG